MAFRISVSLPDDLLADFERHKGRLNISAVCADALRAALGQNHPCDLVGGMSATLGVEPVLFGWKGLVETGIPQLRDAVEGLYAFEDHRALYIGRTHDLMQRMGQLAGAAMGGWNLHPGGWRLYALRKSGDIDTARLRFAMFPGADVEKEGDLIRRYNPLLNVKGLVDVPREMLFDYQRLAPAFTEAGVDPAILGALVDEVIMSVRRIPAREPDWKDDQWRGIGRQMGRGSYYLYAGAGAGRVGLWAYDGDRLWFGRAQVSSEAPAASLDELKALVERFRAAWVESDALASPEAQG